MIGAFGTSPAGLASKVWARRLVCFNRRAACGGARAQVRGLAGLIRGGWEAAWKRKGFSSKNPSPGLLEIVSPRAPRRAPDAFFGDGRLAKVRAMGVCFGLVFYKNSSL